MVILLASMKLSEELAWRGFVNQTTYDDPQVLDDGPITFYWGVDPSSDSMTIGNLAAAMMVRHFIETGHKAVLLVGGATGLIGDPDGKASERDLQNKEQIEKNKQAIVGQYKMIFAGQDFDVVDNLDWFSGVKYIDFLRDVGKHVPMRQMLGRDFVQKRVSEGGAGLSYAEFSYVLMQAYDFMHLSKTKNVTLQLCGADQWGNSVAGVDLTRRMTGNEVHVWSAPLVVNKTTGVKFGKTEEGAIWLDAQKTSPYQFYQFWLNVDDEGAEDYLKIYTLLSKKEIESILKEFAGDRGSRIAQKRLAFEATKLIHGEKTANSVQRITETLFGSSDYNKLNDEDYKQLASELPEVELKGDLLAVLVDSGLASSKSEATRLVEQGAVSINGEKVGADETLNVKPGKNVLKRGKNQFAILKT